MSEKHDEKVVAIGREVRPRAVIILVANDDTLLTAPSLQNPRALIRSGRCRCSNIKHVASLTQA